MKDNIQELLNNIIDSLEEIKFLNKTIDNYINTTNSYIRGIEARVEDINKQVYKIEDNIDLLEDERM